VAPRRSCASQYSSPTSRPIPSGNRIATLPGQALDEAGLVSDTLLALGNMPIR